MVGWLVMVSCVFYRAVHGYFIMSINICDDDDHIIICAKFGVVRASSCRPVTFSRGIKFQSNSTWIGQRNNELNNNTKP